MDRSTYQVRTALIFVAILVVALLGIAARPPGFLSTFWPANAILLGVLLRNPRIFAPIGLTAGALALLAADLGTGSPLLTAVEINAVNLVGIIAGLVTASLLGCFPRRISDTEYTTRFVVIPLAASLAAAVASALRTQLHDGTGAVTELVGWFTADLCTYLIVLPIVLSAPTLHRLRRTFGPSVRRKVRARRIWNTLAPLCTLLLCLPVAVEVQGALALILPMPALLWCALRTSLFSTSLLAAGWSAWALIMAGNGHLELAAPTQFLSESVTTRISVILMALSPMTVAVATTARRRAERTLTRIAERDALTGTLSRLAFSTRSQALLESARQAQRPVAVMMLDLDHFKSVNDNLGHLTGDTVLQQFGNTLTTTVEGLGLCGRIGGEEFAVILSGHSFDEACRIAERIRHTQETKSRTVPGSAGTVSIGVAWADRAPGEVETLLDLADTAMYQAKRDGRNTVVAADAYVCP